MKKLLLIITAFFLLIATCLFVTACEARPQATPPVEQPTKPEPTTPADTPKQDDQWLLAQPDSFDEYADMPSYPDDDPLAIDIAYNLGSKHAADYLDLLAADKKYIQKTTATAWDNLVNIDIIIRPDSSPDTNAERAFDQFSRVNNDMAAKAITFHVKDNAHALIAQADTADILLNIYLGNEAVATYQLQALGNATEYDWQILAWPDDQKNIWLEYDAKYLRPALPAPAQGPEQPSLPYDAAARLATKELTYNGYNLQTTADNLVSELGLPEDIASLADGSIIYYYPGVDYTLASTIPGIYNVLSITVYARTDAPSPRGIRVGDSLAQVLAKFPQEVKLESGKSELVVTTEDSSQMIIYFRDDVVTQYTLCNLN